MWELLLNIIVCGNHECVPWEFRVCKLNFRFLSDDAAWRKCCCSFIVVFYFSEVGASVCVRQRHHWGQGLGTGTDEEKQHLLGNNYLSHPPAASCGRPSHDGCQFAARLSLNQRLCFPPQWAELLTERLTIYSNLFSQLAHNRRCSGNMSASFPRATWDGLLWRFPHNCTSSSVTTLHQRQASDLINGIRINCSVSQSCWRWLGDTYLIVHVL